VSFCAVCDGAFFKGRDVAVCGGGNTALQDARFLSELCRNVTVIHRREEFRGDPMLVDELKSLPNVRLVTSAQVTELLGENGVLTGLRLRDIPTGSITDLAVDGLFEAVGHLPEQTISRSLALTGEDGFLACGEDCITAAPGVFAAGDCRSKEVRQLTTACADGACAAVAAAAYCRTH
jgi:thioredoxin reductase (NADPH)